MDDVPALQPGRVEAERHGNPVAQTIDVRRRDHEPPFGFKLLMDGFQETVGIDHVLEHFERRNEIRQSIPRQLPVEIGLEVQPFDIAGSLAVGIPVVEADACNATVRDNAFKELSLIASQVEPHRAGGNRARYRNQQLHTSAEAEAFEVATAQLGSKKVHLPPAVPGSRREDHALSSDAETPQPSYFSTSST